MIFVYMNPVQLQLISDWIHSFSFRIEHSIRNETSLRNHANVDRLCDRNKNGIDVYYGQN